MNDYNKLFKDNITKNYEKSDDKILNEVNLETEKLTNYFKIHYRIKNYT